MIIGNNFELDRGAENTYFKEIRIWKRALTNMDVF